MTQESCHFENQDSISSYQSGFDQNQILNVLVSYPFPEIKLEDECEPALQFSNSSPIFESISTPVVLPELSNILEQVLIPIIPELESIISPFHISSVDKNQDSISLRPFELAQNFENHLNILARYPFPEIELMQACDPDPQVGNSISLFDSIMTPVSLTDFFYIPESTLNPVPVHHKIESLMSYDHTSLTGKVYKHLFFDLDPIFEPISTLILNLDLI